jgi:enoyl-CoA hydratase
VTAEFATLIVEEIGHIRRITLNRPEHHNPITPRSMREVLRAVELAEADPQVRVVIIRGSGRSFSSGYGYLDEDAEEGHFAPDGSIEDDVTAMISLGSGWGRIWDCLIPVIAQVHGNCLAGGTDLALHCDVVVAAEDARIGFPAVRSMGVPPTHMWIYNVGPQLTKLLLLTGDTVTGLEAKEMGLVVATAPANELDQVALDLASRMALIGRDLLIGNKRVVNMGVELMGRSQLQKFTAMSDAIGHLAPEATAFSARVREIGLRKAVRERDDAFGLPTRTKPTEQ